MPVTQRPIVVVANTLPVRRVKRKSRYHWQISPGGLVSALVPFVREAGGNWVGGTGTSGPVSGPFSHEGISNIPVAISAKELEHHYEGFCNRTLWPLYHDAIRQPEYHRHWWRAYQEVNLRFTEHVAGVVPKGGAVWVQDYHLQLVPALLRERRPDLRIGFFLHVPFPPDELFVRIPWRRQLLEGMLGADILGFQTRSGARNFSRLAHRIAEAGCRPQPRCQTGRRSPPAVVFRFPRLAIGAPFCGQPR